MTSTNQAVEKSIDVLVELLDAKNPDHVRLEAAREILKFSNFESAMNHNV